MSEQGPSIPKIKRTGERKKEFDSLFYTVDLIRRQYIMDRYLKRAKKGDKSKASEARKLAKPEEDLEDFKEIVSRGWINGGDIIKYYSGSGVIPPLIPVYEEIVLTGPKTVILTNKTENKQTFNYKEPTNVVNWENPSELKAYFDNLEKKEQRTENKKLKELGFNFDTKAGSKGYLQALSDEVKKENKRKQKLIDFRDSKELKMVQDKISKPKEMWVREKDAKNYKNEFYIEQQEKFKKRVWRPEQGKTKKEKDDELLENNFKRLKLSETIPDLLERLKTITVLEKKKPAIFLDTEPERKKWKRLGKAPERRSVSPISSKSSSSVSSRRSSTSSKRSSVSSNNSNKSFRGYDDE